VASQDTGRGEVRVHGLAVGGWRARARRILLMRGFWHGADDFLLPELLAVGAGESEKRAPFAAVKALRQEHAVAPDDRRRVPGTRERDFPADVVRGAPGKGKRVLVADAGGMRSTPRWPVVGHGKGGQEQPAEQGHQAAPHARSSFQGRVVSLQGTGLWSARLRSGKESLEARSAIGQWASNHAVAIRLPDDNSANLRRTEYI